MLKYVSRGAALLLLGSVLAFPYVSSYVMPKDVFTPDVKADLAGKYVTVPAQDKPGEVSIWQFDASDAGTYEQLDNYADKRRKVVYVQADLSTGTDYKLKGVMELQYIVIGSKYYLVAATSVNLKVTEPVKPKITNEHKEDKPFPSGESTTKTAQPLPKPKQ